MNDLKLYTGLIRVFKIMLLAFIAALTTGCACSVLSSGAWATSEVCKKQEQAAEESREQQSQRGLPALQKRADSGDVKAQVALGEFHVFERHPNSNRAVGLTYYDKAGRQGDLQSQLIYAVESHQDCQLKARKLGQKQTDGPAFAPLCVAEWQAMEALANKSCVRRGLYLGGTIQVEVGQALDVAGKADDADFWYVVAVTQCLTQNDRTASGAIQLNFSPRSENSSQQVRGAMWSGVSRGERFPGIPLGTPEVEEKAKARLAMLKAKVAASTVRPLSMAIAP